VTLTTASAQTRRTKHHLLAHEHLLEQRFIGPVDHLWAEGILTLLPQLPTWPAALGDRNSRIRGATTILTWLLSHPGEGWQDRWVAAGADTDLGWIDTLVPRDTRSAKTKRQERISGLVCLLMRRVVLPSCDFLTGYRSNRLFDWVRQIMRPDVFADIEAAAIERGLSERDRGQALCLISKIVLHTGKDVDQLTTDDVLEVFAWSVRGHPRSKEVPGLHTAWDLLSVIRVTPADLTLHAALRRGQRPTT
jgi:hypothetical protein